MVQDPRNSPRRPNCPFSAATPLVLKLYVADNSPISLQALGNLTALLRMLPSACYQLEVIDGLDDPLRAVRDGILVTPTLLKLAPTPTVSLLGDLHDVQHVIALTGYCQRRTHERPRASARRGAAAAFA